MSKLVSVIIRTKNEERWIAQCLQGVFSQRHKNFEVIIVDNESSDKTIEKAKQFGVAKVLPCRDFLPGKALNMGIRESKGDYIACLSGHCIPVNDRWLENLLHCFDDHNVGGAYGRQEPMEFTPDSDKRDLALVFGLDRKVQTRDSFFHNANSMIRREVWDKVPFDETVTNIEDRVWAKEVLEKGATIVYEPEASVYHYHGIHQDGDEERCTKVVRILENLHSNYQYKSIDVTKLNVIALIAVRGDRVQTLKDRPLLAYTIDRVRESKYIKRPIVATDTAEFAGIARDLGAETPFIRDTSYSGPGVNLAQVLQYSLIKLEESGTRPDLVVSLEVTFPFRPKGLLDNMIEHLAKGGFDSVIAAKPEFRAIFKKMEGGEIVSININEGLTPRKYKEPAFMDLKGLGCVTHPELLRKGTLLGEKLGLYEVDNPYSHLEVRSDEDLKMASLLVDRVFEQG